MSDTPRTDAYYNDDENPTYRGYISVEFARQLELELAEERAEIKKLHGILSTIRAADFDVEELRGHQCYAKQWACALRDRLKRLEAEK